MRACMGVSARLDCLAVHRPIGARLTRLTCSWPVSVPGAGAGKTTLCNFLAHRLAGCGAAHRSDDADEEERRRRAKEEQDEAAAAALGGYRVSGEIRVNGQEVSSKFFAKVGEGLAAGRAHAIEGRLTGGCHRALV